MAEKKQDMAMLMLDEFESITKKENELKETKPVTADVVQDDARATALVSMTKSYKARLTTIAKAHGLSLSAFFRLAADEYIVQHKWEGRNF